MTITIDQTKLARITTLSGGKHNRPPNGHVKACVMEAVSYVAGEPWSDHPECVCPVIGAFMRAWNDGLPQDERDALLLPLIPRLVNTKGSKAIETRRSLMAADWLVRVHAPAWLRLAKLTDQAAMLEALPEITDMAQVPSLRGPLEAVRQDADAARDAARVAARAAAWAAARAAARAAAWDAARAAAWDAARDAAWDAARDAAWDAARAAARAAAWVAAWDAARDAAWDAARDAAWDALNDTRKQLQRSALALVERMIELQDAAP